MIIDVWSDVVCPWCFIGKRRLDKAIATLPAGTAVTVRHRAFQLDPTITATVATSDMLAGKYGVGPDQVAAMQARVCSIADGEGLCYDLSGTLSGNTRDAHRLLLWSGERQGALLEAMYSRYFENSGGLFTHEDLADVARTVGLDEDAVSAFLASDDLVDDVERDQLQAHQLGANGVPFVVVDMRYGISGAQDQAVFDQTLAAALAGEGAHVGQ